MYSPRLRDDQIHPLWILAKLRKRPMTKVLWAIVDEYLKAHEEELRNVIVKTVTCLEIRRTA
jgi:hypothetical protein